VLGDSVTGIRKDLEELTPRGYISMYILDKDYREVYPIRRD
jgi:hypothetical protein